MHGHNNTFQTVNCLDESAINIENIDEVTDILINNISITPGFINISCEGNIVATLNYDNKEDDTSFGMSFPFEMKALLRIEDDGYVVDDIEALKIDTSEF